MDADITMPMRHTRFHRQRAMAGGDRVAVSLGLLLEQFPAGIKQSAPGYPVPPDAGRSHDQRAADSLAIRSGQVCHWRRQPGI